MRILVRLSPKARKIVDWIVGVALILFGIVAGPIPILQGWVFILAGFAVLSSHNRWARAIHERIKKVGRDVRERVRRKPRADTDTDTDDN